MRKAIVGTAMLVILPLLIVGCDSAKVAMVANTSSIATVAPGETIRLFLFTVTAEGVDVPIEQMVFEYTSNGVSINDLSWYDEANGTEISGVAYYNSDFNSDGKIFLWPGGLPGAKVVISNGTTKIFSLRGNVVGEGAVTFRVVELVTGKGKIKGLPTAITFLTVQK